ncbi:MAG TPA: LpqB family beta-propeller domain-containing protein [Pyrinomonadaceae bacterium]|jgi:Tol biopolymer transport system component/C-terminal processing protease CtpA/Prc
MVRLKKLSACLLALALWQALAPLAFPALAQNTNNAAPARSLPVFSEPSLSPDRAEIAFVSGGDIWTVPASGGDARLLVSHPATESRPLYSPDGSRLAFTSNRTGNGDLYLLTLDTGDLQRLTFDDNFELVDAWSRDGRWLYYSATARDIAGMNDIYRVGAQGGTPMLVSADRYTNEYFAAPSPDGATLALTARGIAGAQWWRKGSSHLDQSEIWTMRESAMTTTMAGGATRSAPVYESITQGGAKEMWPMWGADGGRIFYVSDRSGAQNIWMRPLGGQPQQVTKFDDGRVLWPSISYDGRTIVFERDFKIWKLDTSGGQPEALSITRRGAAAAPSVERQRLAGTEQIQELSLSPDGKKVAFVWRGEIFAASATDGGDATRVTTSPAIESQVTWAPDSRRLVYVSDRGRTPQLFLYDFRNNSETQLTSGTLEDSTPRFSPDGRWIAFHRAGRELRVLNADTRQERLLAQARFDLPPLNSDRPFIWSPDSRWIAFINVTPTKLFNNIFVVPLDGGGAAQPVSFIANTNSNTVSWSPDGTFLLFETGQRTESGQIARVDLIPRTPRFREDQFRDLFREETPRSLPRPDTRPAPTPEPPTPTPSATPTPSPSPATSPDASSSPAAAADEPKRPAGKPLEIVFEGIRRRLSLLPVGIDVQYQNISPDGKWVVMIGGAVGQQNLYLYSLDELSREPAIARQLTSTSGLKSFAQFSPDSKEVFYLEGNRIMVAPLEARQPPRPVAVSAEMDIDFSREKAAIFNQAWTYMRDNFYDPNFHGVNWTNARSLYEPHVMGARTPDEMRRVLQLMVGELNASHLGVSAPASAAVVQTGRLGLRFDRETYEKTGRLRVTEVLPLSPAALTRDPVTSERTREIRAGDFLLAVDGTEVGARTNLDELLNYKINRRVILTVARTAEGADRREVAVRPVNLATEKALLYRKWVEDKRAYVARTSGGRLGYVHMFDMSSASLEQLYLDLDAENQSREGVVVDIRHNNGGFVNVYAIDVLARRSYLSMTPRGYTKAPARTLLGQRALELPTILVTNQHSLSDAEDFTEGYRTLRLGKVVGEPTAGWIIFTWNVSLIDGSVLRLPRSRIEGNDGKNMELNPRPVDIPVKRPVGESYTERDSQLDTAVGELLKQLGSSRTTARKD